VPPRVIWRRTLDEARELSRRPLAFADERLPGARAFDEVPFGGAEPKSDVAMPWDAVARVEIPGTDFRIAGYIDRPNEQIGISQESYTGEDNGLTLLPLPEVGAARRRA
jgi:hypothetical protein